MMASDPDAGVPNLNLTPEEKRVYGQLFRAADTDAVGVITGEVAVKFFERTKLDSRVLGEIWQIADKENRGFLTPAGFGVVLRLIGHAQAGREPSPELALSQGPIPRFDGFTPTPAPVPVPGPGPQSPAVPAAMVSPQATGSGPIRIPPLTPEKVSQYSALFERQPLQGNMLPGEQAKQIFEKSGLSNEILGRIWMLADTEQRGALVLTEFVIAMHLLTSMKTGALRGLPTILPAALYEAATRRAPVGGIPPPGRSPTTATPPLPPAARHLTGPAQLTQTRTGSPLGRPPLPAQPTGDWLINPADKARFDLLYEELDKQKKGFITGEEAVPFFSQSNLNEDALAQIWDLADINSAGRLTRDEFAVAMYLIREQRLKPGQVPLPTTLPPNLIPPSMRTPQQSRPQTAGGFQPQPPRPQPPAPKPSALDDLFGLDDPQPSAAAQAPVQVPIATGGSVDPFGNSASPIAPASPIRPVVTGSNFKPFVPSSSFGRGLTTHATGGSNSSAPAGGVRSPLPPTVEDDLLGDADPEVNNKLSNETTELANLSNQIGSLTKQVQDVQTQRTNTQNELSQASQQKKNFEQRLTQLRALYEKEAQDVRALETQLNTAKAETKKLQTEFAMVEASYLELQNQHRTVVAGLQADQQENASLKEKIRTVNGEIAQLKPLVEKLKSEARQQKGLVAINKKQLSTVEGEKGKLQNEVEDLNKEKEELARQVELARQASPVPQVASPALSTGSGNNPFFRRTGSADISAAFASPMRSMSGQTFDDVFGPSLNAPAQSPTPPPLAVSPVPQVAAFKAQNTGTSTNSFGSGSFATPGSTSPTISRQPTITAESANVPGAFSPFGEPSGSGSRAPSRHGSQDQTPAAPAALPIEPVQTGQSATSNRPMSPASTTSQSKSAAAAAAPVEADPFAVNTDAKAKEDFESAFASFKNTHAKPAVTVAEPAKAATFSKFDSEFPPISELERDDDESDSESEAALATPPAVTTSNANFDDDIWGTGSPAPAAAPVAAPVPTSTTTQPPAAAAPAAAAPAIAQPPAATSQSSKGAFDDLDDEFADLEDAKEGSSADDVEDFANISRSGFGDDGFGSGSVGGSQFGSPPPSQPSQSKSGASDFDLIPSHQATQSQGSFAAPKADAHDWDAIFAGLDEGSQAQQGSGQSPFESLETPRPGSSANPQGQQAGGEQQKGGEEQKKEGAAGELERPAPAGRALTTTGEHDDPIVKNLTSMGYSRDQAVRALEKYDYNLERAANFLASQS
ncbi:unnamed protein product [Sordaria macrospora k-hell]|uniref:WGS project CABT00000000 data, contig 2.53 n=1 Tax=Sordaria macrospora (strain ATCC MYA-333 / DSM 997 / K(L3346) / K-hell) TaxID=771870 RepID=F7W9K3_SORMK|nr:uncharacterized protein SMAC_08160 [Sordaria macrospora k-hell]CCC13994.1 unnamed protein product [Sordaria macrospora k-hell]